jgi:hypothetical protein
MKVQKYDFRQKLRKMWSVWTVALAVIVCVGFMLPWENLTLTSWTLFLGAVVACAIGAILGRRTFVILLAICCMLVAVVWNYNLMLSLILWEFIQTHVGWVVFNSILPSELPLIAGIILYWRYRYWVSLNESWKELSWYQQLLLGLFWAISGLFIALGFATLFIPLSLLSVVAFLSFIFAAIGFTGRDKRLVLAAPGLMIPSMLLLILMGQTDGPSILKELVFFIFSLLVLIYWVRLQALARKKS